MVLGVLAKAGATVRARAIFYKLVFQVVLIYDSKIWVIMESMMKVMEAFRHLVDWSIAEKKAWRIRAKGQEWLPVEEALEAEGLWHMQDYARRCRVTIEENI